MSIQELLASSGGALLLLLTLVQITPIKVNPWSRIAKSLGNALNGDLTKKVDMLSVDLQNLRNDLEVHEAMVCRTNILHFGDELLHGVRHSKEHFDQIMSDIKTYEDYCDSHPRFENNVADETIKRINEVYHECLRNNSFLK